MPKYRITVLRAIEDAQARTVIVQAMTREAAEFEALHRAGHDEGFWDSAQIYSVDVGEPVIDIATELLTGEGNDAHNT